MTAADYEGLPVREPLRDAAHEVALAIAEHGKVGAEDHAADVYADETAVMRPRATRRPTRTAALIA